MLQPKKRKYRKDRKGRDRGLALCGNRVSFGEFGLKSITRARITARQIEAARRAITKRLKKGGQIWIRVFPDKPISKKPLEVRQGSGKGNVEYWVAVVKPGSMIFEVSGISRELAMDAFTAAGNKLPVKTIFEERVIK